jgi:Penicillin-insensitive murein endopeptidase
MLAVRAAIVAALVLVLAAGAYAGQSQVGGGEEQPVTVEVPIVPPPVDPPAPPPGAPGDPAQPGPDIPRPFEAIRWRRSRSLGLPFAGGRLVNGVKLPAEGELFFTWDPVRKQTPNRWWRRWGADKTLRRTLAVLRRYNAAYPFAGRVGIGDISRTQGGDFGRRFGPLGHASHQNGLDIDVYYPRVDGLERAPLRPAQVDRMLAQKLVDLFVEAGARKVFVGPSLGLRGPRRIVVPLANHDNHLHARFAR